MPHTCQMCKETFSQKGHLDAHLQKKKTCEKCNVNFTTQYAYINKKYVHVDNYKKVKGDKIKCIRSHELVMCQGEKVKKYFRHKNTEDVCGPPMTEWHSRMQSYFPITEKDFKKLNDEQTKNRRADVFIEDHNCIVEIQHSEIDDANVICRNKDYELHGMTVIWLIDGNTTDICLEELSTGNYLIIFKNSWKYKSFRHTYEFVLLDIADKIFKIAVKKICNEMILVKEWQPIKEVMKVLNNTPKQIWLQWMDDNEIKATLTVHQKGAGNGKTYGIWKSIVSNRDKETFVIITKQKSAVQVILKELNDQEKRDEWHIDENMDNLRQHEIQNKCVVKYKHKISGRECTVIIGTIDSFFYNLTDASKSASDFFNTLVKSISEKGCTKLNEYTGSMTYAREQIKLNKKTEIWIDETQDLNVDYFRAIIKIMWETKIDVIVVGDKLQSLEYRQNFMTCVDDDIPNITVIKHTPVNINRRITVKNMSEQLNSLINFNNYSLPEISFTYDQTLTEQTNPVLEVIDTPLIYANNNSADNFKRITMFVDNLICLVDKEVRQHNYIPEDFLFIFPIMKCNNTASELETKLNNYWINKIGTNDYKNYAVLHKHEEGVVIEMKDSTNASRIVTIRTSKGDGRKVVFLLGCTEQSLKLVSRSTDIDLIYESYLHVGLTRAKEKIFFGLLKNNDDLHRRFGETGITEYKPIITCKIKIQDILTNINKEEVIKLLEKKGLQEECEEKKEVVIERTTVDWQYHCIRRAIYMQYAICIIMDKNIDKDDFNKSQLSTVIYKIYKLKPSILTPKQFYEYLNNLGDKGLDCLPICDLSQKPIYKGYLTNICDLISDNKNSYKKHSFKSLGEQTPIQSVIQQYYTELFMREKFHEITPTMLYNIIDCFAKESDSEIANLLKESERIKSVTKNVMNEIMNNNKCNIRWNIEHMIFYGGNHKDLDIYKPDVPIIGFSDDTVFHMMFKTDFSKINYWETLIEVLLERFLISNTKAKGDDVTKFKNKHIKTFLIILKQNNYKVFDWNWEQSIATELKELFKNAIIQHYSISNSQLFTYLSFIKNNKNKWINDFKTPYAYLAQEFDNSPYVRNFFKNLDTRYKNEKEIILEITNSHDKFCKYLTENISEMCDSFFGLYMNDGNDDDEW